MDEFEMEQMHYEIDAMRAENEGLRAAYEALRQASADLCVVCGWRFFVPDEGCQGCERARLEAEVDALRLQRVLDNEEAARLYDFARDKGQALERAAVVAWLRERNVNAVSYVYNHAADAIERGVHRREEKP